MNQANINDGESGLSVRGKLNIMKDNIISSAHLGKVRSVYLVQDAADVTHLTGAGNYVYQTAQDAYNAANTIQIALGGTNKVIVFVGNTTSATVGNITLSANYNVNVIFVGLGPNISEIGNITASNAGGNGYTIGGATLATQAKFINLKVGDLTTSATGGSGNSGTIGLLLEQCFIGNLNTSITDAMNTTGTGGNVRVGFGTVKFSYSIGDITTSSQSTSKAAGTVNILTTSSTVTTGNIVSANNNTGGTITITAKVANIGAITQINSTATSLSSFENCRISSITYTTGSAIKLTNCEITGTSTINSISATNPVITYVNTRSARVTLTNDFTVKVVADNCKFESIDNLGDDSVISNSLIDITGGAANDAINDFGENCRIINSFVRSIAPDYAINTTTVGKKIYLDNTKLIGGSNNAALMNDEGMVTLTDTVAGTFDCDGSKESFFYVPLTGGNLGANVLNVFNPICNKTYKVLVDNSLTGTDTLSLTSDIGGVPGSVYYKGGAYTPSATGYDILKITVDASGNLFVDHENYS